MVAALESGITVEINGEEVTLRSFEDICEAVEGLTFEELPIATAEILVEKVGESQTINEVALLSGLLKGEI